ncbi:DUF779 domain-containing protein [Methyloceanibacter caenitepidi]|uniref:Acetaldehyde dehydrogenase n=1 Tax=Methyloceanibacter caenitepidi TaxID=1384459 RepID=A0A0A8K2Q9_9HYPH|nr:DUF779 domain-containing protein [Methyloceanibacter caenitepidi]BAQ16274.1 hypothetical protein GL4_0812 [Methyloceanibacter caenitepidi]
MVERVLATDAALEIIDKLRTKHGPLMFHQSGGCSYGSAPMCHLDREFALGVNDIRLGEIGGCPVYMDADQFETCRHAQLTVDVAVGQGSAFSMETPEGLRFITRSREFTDSEKAALEIGDKSGGDRARHEGDRVNG